MSLELTQVDTTSTQTTEINSLPGNANVSEIVQRMTFENTERLLEMANMERTEDVTASEQLTPKKELSKLKFGPEPKKSNFRYVSLQEWEGYVSSIHDDEFTARLADVTAGSSALEEEATFPISDVVESDRDLLVPGAVFRWSIGYAHHGRTRMRSSMIAFRRLPQWLKSDIERANQRALELQDSITVE